MGPLCRRVRPIRPKFRFSPVDLNMENGQSVVVLSSIHIRSVPKTSTYR